MEIRINVEGKDGTEAEGMREALVAALEGFFGLRPNGLARTASSIGYVMNSLSLIDEPGRQMIEWRQVALSKWNHYREMIEAYEKAAKLSGGIPSSVAITIHEAGLARMVPYLLGMPELALMPRPEVEGNELPGKVSFGPHSGKIDRKAFNIPAPKVEQDFMQETHGNWGPHHNEERMPAYPSEGLDFTDRPPVPDAFEHGSSRLAETEDGSYLIERGKHPGEH